MHSLTLHPFFATASYTTHIHASLQTVLHVTYRCKNKEKQKQDFNAQHHSEHTPFFNIAKSNTERSSTTQSSQPKTPICAQFTLRKEHHDSSSWVGRQTLSKHISKQRTIEMIPENIVLTVYVNSIGIPFCCTSPLKGFCLFEFCGL